MVEAKITTFERHSQTALVMLVVALLIWVGKSVQDTSIAVAQMQVEIRQMQDQIQRPDGKFKEIELRLDTIEKQLQRMVDEHSKN